MMTRKNFAGLPNMPTGNPVLERLGIYSRRVVMLHPGPSRQVEDSERWDRRTSQRRQTFRNPKAVGGACLRRSILQLASRGWSFRDSRWFGQVLSASIPDNFDGPDIPDAGVELDVLVPACASGLSWVLRRSPNPAQPGCSDALGAACYPLRNRGVANLADAVAPISVNTLHHYSPEGASPRLQTLAGGRGSLKPRPLVF